jgi:hypothetical protein
MDGASPWTSRLVWLELAAVGAAAIASLLFSFTLPGRLPSDDDYASVVTAIRAELAVGDAVTVAPAWAERARSLLPGVDFVSAPELHTADLTRVKRLWLIGLPAVPRSDAAQVAQDLAIRLTADAPARPFGKLTLQRFSNPAFHEPRFDFTRDIGRAQVYFETRGQRLSCTRDGEHHACPRGPTVQAEWREIDFAPYRCVGANPVGGNIPLVIEYPDALLGKSLQVMAAVTGEMGWRHGPGLTPVDLQIEIDGQPAGSVHIAVGTVPPQRISIDTQKLDPAQPHRVRFAVSTMNPQDREFCFDAQAD